jgi:two-component system, OmpR family, sensor kinase
MSRARLGLRGRLMLSVLGAIAIALAMLTVGFNLVLGSRLDHDANTVAMARASSELAALRVKGARIALGETPDAAALDSPIWVFERGHALERPRAGGADQRAAAALAAGPRGFADVAASDTRMYALPVVQNATRVGTVVSAISLRAYQQTEHIALLASIVLALLAFLAVAVAARWLISRALRPVSRMTRQAAEWSDRDVDRRFSLGEPHDELTQLAQTLDGLLDRLAASLRHEQRLSAELSHELRTPLAHITAEAQYAVRHARGGDEYRAGYEQILQSAARMGRTLETLIAAARAEVRPPRTTTNATTCARAAAEAVQALAEETGVSIEAPDPRTDLRVAVEPDLIERILAPLLENACHYARRRVRVLIEGRATSILYTVEDDGPGVPVRQAEAIFEPGYRGEAPSARAPTGQGAGLGLALARRLARAAGGDVTADGSNEGGRFLVRLPTA